MMPSESPEPLDKRQKDRHGLCPMCPIHAWRPRQARGAGFSLCQSLTQWVAFKLGFVS